MSLPDYKVKKIKATDNHTYEIIPERLQNSGYEAALPTLTADTTLATSTDLSNKMDKTNPTGTGYFSLNRATNTTIGINSVAVGENNTASGECSYAEGASNEASGTYSHAEGFGTDAKGHSSHAEGNHSATLGTASHAEGNSTRAIGEHSHAEGYQTIAYADISHAEGHGTTLSSRKVTGDANATTYTINDISDIFAGCIISYHFNYAQILSVNSTNSTIRLDKTLSETQALSSSSVTITTFGIASAYEAHAENSSAAVKSYSHSEGYHTIAAEYYAHAEGKETVADGKGSHSEGKGTRARRSYQHVFGEYNEIDAITNNSSNPRGDGEGTYIEIVGNGTADNARSNARTLDWSGNEWLAGNLQAAGLTDGTTTKTMAEVLSGIHTHPNKSALDGFEVTTTSVTDGTTTFNQYVHPTATQTAAGLYRVGCDGLGHVVLGTAFTIPDISNMVTTDTNQTISGIKTFNAPTNIVGTEQTTMKLKTSNGGAIIFGKEGPNSGSMIRLDQTDGTCRLRFRSSATTGAMVWEQPENGSRLYMDFKDSSGNTYRVSSPTKAGTLAIAGDYIPLSGSSTITGSLTPNAASNTQTLGTSSKMWNAIYGTNFYSSSDKRLKENIKDVELDCSRVIKDIELKEFNFIDDKEKKVVVGAIAQQLNEILPERYKKELISGNENSYYSINESKLVYIVIGALKEEQKKNKELEERISNLEKRLEDK